MRNDKEDTILRSDAIKALRERWARTTSYDGIGEDIGEECEEVINALPSADRPQGEWVESFKPITVKQGAYTGIKFVHDGWSCSECSEVVEKRYPNCPYCLARMRGADDE